MKATKRPARLGAHYILRMRASRLYLELVARRILAVFQQARVATTGRCAAAFLDVVIGRIGETQHRLTEVLAELIFFREQFQALALGLQRRIEDKIAVTGKHCARDLALHWRHKAHRSRAQMEMCRRRASSQSY